MHLTALSGYNFVHFLFDSSISTLQYSRKSLELKQSEDHVQLGLHGSRLTVLEQQFAAFKSQKELEYAVQQEANDWNENMANESFFVITGLPPPVGKLTGGAYIHGLLMLVMCDINFRCFSQVFLLWWLYI